MKPNTTGSLIIAFILLTSFALLVVPAGQPRYRRLERVEAMKTYTLSPSEATKAALNEEFARLHLHEATLTAILLPTVLVSDAVLIYFFWNYGRQKTAA
jgi:hypothetical protein